MTDKDFGALPASPSVPTEGHGAAVLAAESALLQLAQWARQAFVHATDTDQIAARHIAEKMAIVRTAFCKTTTANSVGTDERSEEVNQEILEEKPE